MLLKVIISYNKIISYLQALKMLSNNMMIKGENVLVIGSGPSGMDIGRKILPVAKKVTMSQRFKGDLNFIKKWFHVKGDVVRLTENGAVFDDGSSEEFSTILYATGKCYNVSICFYCVNE